MHRSNSFRCQLAIIVVLNLLALSTIAVELTLTTTDAIANSLNKNENSETPFDITARLNYIRTRHATALAVDDTTGAVAVFLKDGSAPSLHPGDIVRIKGTIRQMDTRKRRAEVTDVHRLASGLPPTPRNASLGEILQGTLDYRLVRTIGVLRDCRLSETGVKWVILVVSDGNGILYVSVPINNDNIAPFRNLVGSTIALTGVILPGDYTARLRIGRTLKLADESGIEDLGAPPGKHKPSLSTIGPLSPAEVAALGQHVTTGCVLAVWAHDNVLLKSLDGDIHGLVVAEGQLPGCGQWIEAIGLPESDLFHLNLTHANWKPIIGKHAPSFDSSVRNVCVRELTTDELGAPRFSVCWHGKLVSISGEILTIANDANGFGRLFIQSDGFVFPVELSEEALSRAATIPLSSKINVTGICILDTDSWRPNSAFPQIRGFRLVTRTPADLHLIELPPFWSAARLITVIGALLGALVAIFVWNLALRRKAERRGRELAQASIAQIASELKVDERTHLAVELHDTLSQSITGACLEVNAAQEFIRIDMSAATRYLSLAAKTLASCRNELRNCLWDLRSQALEVPDLNIAIRKTLEPYVNEDVALSIRFNIPRDKLPDNTVHALMRIVRELVLNAIHHGKASAVAIAGCIDGHLLRFSVKDNGCGFDPAAAPGSSAGHFGLQGIRERLRELGGTISIDSAKGTGCKVSVSIVLNTQEQPK